MATFETEYNTPKSQARAMQAQGQMDKELRKAKAKRERLGKETKFWEKVYLTALLKGSSRPTVEADRAVKDRQTFLENQKFIAECKERGE